MKKFFTIPLALLILLSGMHFTVATHYCGGKLAATKVSFSGKKATCGMASDERSETSSEIHFAKKCCDNESAVYSVDGNYSPSEFHYKDITQHILHVFYIPDGFSFLSTFPSLTKLANDSPPGYYLAKAVSMAFICVFRI